MAHDGRDANCRVGDHYWDRRLDRPLNVSTTGLGRVAQARSSALIQGARVIDAYLARRGSGGERRTDWATGD